MILNTGKAVITVTLFTQHSKLHIYLIDYSTILQQYNVFIAPTQCIKKRCPLQVYIYIYH